MFSSIPPWQKTVASSRADSVSNCKATDYHQFIKVLSSKDSQFQPLNAFISSPSTIEAKIRLVTFRRKNFSRCKTAPRSILVQEADLDKQLQKGADKELYIVEDLSPKALKILGGHCNVDARFFLDYLDTVLQTPSTPPASKVTRYGTVTLPWYRYGDVENHLPALRSVQKTSKHVCIHFISPVEYHPDNTATPSRSIRVTDRLHSTQLQNNIERIAGGHNAINLQPQILWPVAMTRHSAAVWFDAGTKWRKAIILLDPPFEFSQGGLKGQKPKYRSFETYSDPSSPSALQTKMRESYASSLVHCLEQNSNLWIEQPCPVTIIQDLYRIIASEWIAVNAYLERDLNVIEWRLENEVPRIVNLDLFLQQLFTMRRRIRKYECLIKSHLRIDLPSAWVGSLPLHKLRAADQAFNTDTQQALDLIQRSNERLSQTVSLITSLMSVIESKRATSLNQRLTLLTILATVALPFNVFAAILGMETEYAPGNSKSFVFWGGAGGTVVLVLIFYACWLMLPLFKEMRMKLFYR